MMSIKVIIGVIDGHNSLRKYMERIVIMVICVIDAVILTIRGQL